MYLVVLTEASGKGYLTYMAQGIVRHRDTTLELIGPTAIQGRAQAPTGQCSNRLLVQGRSPSHD